MKILEKISPCDKIKIKGISVSVIIGKVKFNKNSYDGKILGRKLYDWVSFACNGKDIKFIDISKGDNILEKLKSHINRQYDYTLFLPSSIPLITKVPVPTAFSLPYSTS